MIPDRPTAVDYITNERDCERAVLEIERWPVRGWDLETYNTTVKMEKAAVYVELGARPRLSLWALPNGQVFMFDSYKVRFDFHNRVFAGRKALTVGHNLKFDTKFIQFWYGVIEFGDLFDTMLGDQILAEGDINKGFSLRHLMDRYFNEDISKEEQVSDWSIPELSESQLTYASRDALYPLRIWEKMTLLAIKHSKQRVFKTEFDIIVPIASMESNGLYLNKEMWAKQCREMEREAHETKLKLWEMFDDGSPTLFKGVNNLNVDSKPQMKEAFRRKGLPIPLTKTGRETLSKDALKPLIDQYPEIKLYREYSLMAKAISSYGYGWLDLPNPATGRIHANCKIIGAETGRMAFNNPNLQQIKQDDSYRNCFEAQGDYVFVDADFSQMELRILAEYCLDPNLLKAYDENLDLHQFTAHKLFDTPFDEVEKKDRTIAKNQNFRIVYGGGPHGLADAVGISLDHAKHVYNLYTRNVYPIMARWLETQGQKTVNKMRAWAWSGRSCKYFGDLTDEKVVRQIERWGKNFPIQSASADITKRSVKLIWDQIKHYRGLIKLVHVVHDQIILECRPDYALQAKALLYSSMMQAEREYLKRVPSAVDVHITKMWAKEPTEEQLQAAMKLVEEYV